MVHGVLAVVASDADNFRGRGRRQQLDFRQRPRPPAFAPCTIKAAFDLMDDGFADHPRARLRTHFRPRGAYLRPAKQQRLKPAQFHGVILTGVAVLDDGG